MLTVDWPLDRFGRGDIALRVQPEDWSEAELLLSNLDSTTDRLDVDPRHGTRAVVRLAQRLEPVREPPHRLTQHKRRGS